MFILKTIINLEEHVIYPKVDLSKFFKMEIKNKVRNKNYIIKILSDNVHV